ncbi:MAG: 2-phospho-L-lactate transferase [Betaproteobacteria bacterium]|nr:2-phospho-L-lactate transferase [Betaproteobacteria bacterium]
MILALAGGVGGAKLATGLARALPPSELMIVVNTADDFEHLGLHISPDLDTVMYNLAGVHDPELGWGIANETWNFMAALKMLGGETWFQLGDRDLATHLERTRRLKAGEGLTSVTQALHRSLGVQHAIVPMSDDSVRTIVHTESGRLAFQDYFVRLKCEPAVKRIEYEGAARARPSAAFSATLGDERLRGIVICPSNPFLSVAPILAIPGVREKLQSRQVPVIAVSPIVGGRAIKGPAAKLFQELGKEASVTEVARFYRGLVDKLAIDEVDRPSMSAIRDLGIEPVVARTVMSSDADKELLAREVVSACVPGLS